MVAVDVNQHCKVSFDPKKKKLRVSVVLVGSIVSSCRAISELAHCIFDLKKNNQKLPLMYNNPYYITIM